MQAIWLLDLRDLIRRQTSAESSVVTATESTKAPGAITGSASPVEPDTTEIFESHMETTTATNVLAKAGDGLYLQTGPLNHRKRLHCIRFLFQITKRPP